MKKLVIPFIFLIATFIIACGPGQKGTRLQDLERMLADPDASQVKKAPGGKSIYQEARQYRRLALEAWEDGKEKRSEEYAFLGWLKYRTAVAVYEQYQAKDRLDVANAKVEAINPELKAVNDEELKLADEVTRLENRLALLNRQKLQRGNSKSMVAHTKTQKAKGESLSEFNKQLLKIEAAKNKADKVNAKKHGAAMYAKADNIRKSIKLELSTRGIVTVEMMRKAKHSLVYFEQATQKSAEGYKEEIEKQDPVKRQRSLISALSAAFTSSKIEVEAGGVRVVFNTSFHSESAVVGGVFAKQLGLLLPIIKRFDGFQLLVEGFTEKGDATENLGLSQNRAMAVRDYLSSKGAPKSRIKTSGRGQNNLRFPTSIENNRVEIVFHY